MSTDHNFWRERRAQADLNRGSSAYQPNALLLGQTGLQRGAMTSLSPVQSPTPHKPPSFSPLSLPWEHPWLFDKLTYFPWPQQHLWLMYWSVLQKCQGTKTLTKTLELQSGLICYTFISSTKLTLASETNKKHSNCKTLKTDDVILTDIMYTINNN